MFGLLRNKLSSFIKGLTGREEKKEASPEEKPPVGAMHEHPQMGLAQEKPQMEMKQEKPLEKKPAERIEHKPAAVLPGKKPQTGPMQAKPLEKMPELIVEAPKPKNPEKKIEITAEAPKPALILEKTPEIRSETPKPTAPFPKPASFSAQIGEFAKPEAPPQKKSMFQSVVGVFTHKSEPAQMDASKLERKAMSDKREMAPKIGIGTAIKSIFSNEITIGEGEVSDLLEELELSLLEADVAYDVSLEVTSLLRRELVGMKVPKGEVEARTKETIMRIIESVMDSDRKFDLVERAKGMHKPVKILFVGPNGAGKTTTIAKMARLLLDNHLTVVFSASDTFRAAAIEQTEVHAERLGVKVIKSKYGADPASVAFDAINHASSHSIDVVLIDSAGRQDTNANLLSELKKIVRVAKPDMKIYIGESIGGNAIIEQIRAFDYAIGIDGAILTKIDCDAKGGTAISVAKATGTPVLYLGVGQGYSDLVPFDAHKIAQEIMT